MSMRNQPLEPEVPAPYRSQACVRLLPWQVRERRFKQVGMGRRGLEPGDVYAFLDRVADDLAVAYAALDASRRETATIKDALHRWQSEQGRARQAERGER
ncbi:DivIVA domain-containing protein [Micromonospora chersina]|uniref:DivIVA domain-containing protein n=1 Tax=Micromonospora chersina TaxID=47854 RepID=UPI003409FB58